MRFNRSAIVFIAILIMMWVVTPVSAGPAEPWLAKERTVRNDIDQMVFRLRALAAEPGLNQTFGWDTFSYLPDFQVLALMRIAFYSTPTEGTSPLKEALADSLRALENAVANHPRDADILSNLAYVSILARKDREARQMLVRALKANPGHEKTWRYIIILLSGIDKKELRDSSSSDELEEALRLAIEQAPEQPLGYLALAFYYIRHNCKECAANVYNDLRPFRHVKSPQLYHAFGRIFLRAVNYPKRYEEAQQVWIFADGDLFDYLPANLPEAYKMYYSENAEKFRGSNGKLKPIEEVKDIIRVLIRHPGTETKKMAQALYSDHAALLAGIGYPEKAVEKLKLAKALRVRYEPYEASGVNIPSIAQVDYSIGHAYLRKGNMPNAIQHIGVKLFEQEREKRGTDLAVKALGSLNSGDYPKAQSLLEETVILAPDNPFWWAMLAKAASGGKNYADSAIAWDRAFDFVGTKVVIGLDEATFQRTPANCFDAGFIHLLMADCSKAVKYFEEGYGLNRADKLLSEWLLVASFGEGQMEAATKMWLRQRPDLSQADLQWGVHRRDLLNVIHNGFNYLAERAEKERMLYAAFQHSNDALRALLASADFLPRDWAAAKKIFWMDKLASIYQRLPAKPRLSPPAAKWARAAEKAIEAGDLRAAEQAYRQALTLDPWWPEGHYNLALVLESAYGLSGMARAEMGTFLKIDPQGQLASRARRKFENWNDLIRAAESRGARFPEDIPFMVTPDAGG